jgi:hypothetical protein
MKECFYNWVFHYNPYTKEWAAIPRESYNKYWSDYNTEGVIRSSQFTTLFEIIQKTEGVDIEKKLNIEL